MIPSMEFEVGLLCPHCRAEARVHFCNIVYRADSVQCCVPRWYVGRRNPQLAAVRLPPRSRSHSLKRIVAALLGMKTMVVSVAVQDQQLLAARRRPLVGAIGPAVGGGAVPIPTLAEALLGRVPLAACARTGFVCVGALGFIRK